MSRKQLGIDEKDQSEPNFLDDLFTACWRCSLLIFDNLGIIRVERGFLQGVTELPEEEMEAGRLDLARRACDWICMEMETRIKEKTRIQEQLRKQGPKRRQVPPEISGWTD